MNIKDLFQQSLQDFALDLFRGWLKEIGSTAVIEPERSFWKLTRKNGDTLFIKYLPDDHAAQLLTQWPVVFDGEDPQPLWQFTFGNIDQERLKKIFLAIMERDMKDPEAETQGSGA